MNIPLRLRHFPNCRPEGMFHNGENKSLGEQQVSSYCDDELSFLPSIQELLP